MDKPINLIIATDSLNPPLTGIGYYTAHLVDEFLNHPEIGQIKGLNHSGIQSESDLQRHLQTLTSGELGTPRTTLTKIEQPHATHTKTTNEVANKPSSTSWRMKVKNIIKKIPGAYALARRWHAFRHKVAVHRELGKDPGIRWLVHGPNYTQPGHGGDLIITVHDFSHIRYPETHPQERVEWLNKHLPQSLNRAAKVICVSEFTRQELLDLNMVDDPQKAVVCHNGVDPSFRQKSGDMIEEELRRWGLGYKGYILSAATLEPRKNLQRLLDAYEQLPDYVASQFSLVLAGSAGWKNNDLRQRIARIRPPRHVITTGYIEREALQDLICGARCFAYISIYEGFGLPVVEAMACGTPVLTSNTTALKEVAADSGYTVDPTDTTAIATALDSLLTDDDLAAKLSAKGIERSSLFSWQRCAQEHIDVYKQVMASQQG